MGFDFFKEKNGFTLVEFLLYFGLVVFIFIIFSLMAFNMFRGKVKLSSIEEVNQNARLAIEKIISITGNSTGINAPLISQSGPTLSLAMADPLRDPTIFDASGGILTIKQGTAQAVELTSDETVINELLFSNLSYPDTPGTVRIKLTIARNNPQGTNAYDVEKTFFTTVNIRKK